MEILFSDIIPSPIPESLIRESEVWGREFTFRKGDKVLVSAESGKGKTTLINIILGLRKDYTGNLLIDNDNIRSFSINKLSQFRKENFSIVPQGLMLFDQLSAWENVQIKNKISNFMPDDEIKGLFEKFGIAEQINKKTRYMSFGQNQRVAIIRALCQNYDFLLLDEPFSHLDNKNRDIIWETLSDYVDKQKAGVLITSLSSNVSDNFTKKITV